MPERRLPPLFAAVLAVGVVAFGVGLFFVGSSLPSGSAAVGLPNRPVDSGAADPLDLRAHNSPTVAQSPRAPGDLVVVNRVDLPQYSCALHVSHDAGASWADVPLPFPDGEEQPSRCFAPDAGFGPDGTLYVAFVTLAGQGNEPHALWLAASSDAGRHVPAPVKVAGPLAFQARLAVDPLRRGRLFLTWLQASAVGDLTFSGPAGVVATRSDDGGTTWTPPVAVSGGPTDERPLLAPSPAVDGTGTLMVAYLDLLGDRLDYAGAHRGLGGEPYGGKWRLLLARSGDGGATWKENVVEPALTPTQRVVALFPPTPSLAVDGRHVYLAYADGRLGDADVWLWASHDGGVTFGRAVRVNDTPRRDRTAQYLPALSVTPGGRLDVAYYDRRADPASVENDVSFQSSGDHGKTFSPRLRLDDRPSDSRIGPGADRSLADLGSRLGLVSTRTGAVAAWADTRAGTDVSLKQDLAVASVRFSTPAAGRAPLRAVGLAAAAAGLGVAAAGLGRAGGRPGIAGQTMTTTVVSALDN